MKYADLSKNEIEFLDIYMSLPDEEKRLAEYVTRIGASRIFSTREFADFLEILKDN